MCVILYLLQQQIQRDMNDLEVTGLFSASVLPLNWFGFGLFCE